MATLVDGLGFEELGDAGDPGSKVSQLWVTGSIVTQSELQAAGAISGASTMSATIYSGTEFRTGSIDSIGGITAIQSISGLNVLAQASGIFGVVSDGDGAIKSVFQSQAADVFGMAILAGSITTGDAQTAVLEFAGGSFANGNYHFVMSPRDFTIPAVSGINWMASGTRRASGLTVLGPSGTTFDWIAVGQR